MVGLGVFEITFVFWGRVGGGPSAGLCLGGYEDRKVVFSLILEGRRYEWK